jgi:ribonucleoside-diphosphate reductase alpha chain
MAFNFIKEEQLIFLKEGGYLKPDETTEQRVIEIVSAIKSYEEQYNWIGLSTIIYEMIEKNYLSLSTPVFSNLGRGLEKGRNTEDLPASCNILTSDNSIESISRTNREVKMLSKLGAGIGPNYDLIAPKGTEITKGFYTNSKLDWIEDDVSAAQKISQSSKRRGYCTPYISILDEDFNELLKRVDKNNPNDYDVLVNNTIGIIIPSGFWEEVDKGNQDYQTRLVKVLKERQKTGRLYLLDEDNCNKNNSEVYKKLGYTKWTSNICTEFIQPLQPEYTSVCVISAFNLVYWDEIKKRPDMLKAMFYFLDIVNEEYVRISENIPGIERAYLGAKDKRDIGVGALGFHELLQSKNMAFGDMYSRALNKEIFKTIRGAGEEATEQMAIDVGSATICEKAGLLRRNASLMMVAPNKSTSFISGVTSGGIEPFMSNMFMKNLAKIQHIFKNKHLEKLLDDKGKNTKATWASIVNKNGSVGHLDFLSDHQKDVFKTFTEISPKDIIDLAADRQVYIDMGQSLNLIFRKNYTLKDLLDIHRYGFEKGIKTFYYAYPSSHASLEEDGEDWDSCISCQD